MPCTWLCPTCKLTTYCNEQGTMRWYKHMLLKLSCRGSQKDKRYTDYRHLDLTVYLKVMLAIKRELWKRISDLAGTYFSILEPLVFTRKLLRPVSSQMRSWILDPSSQPEGRKRARPKLEICKKLFKHIDYYRLWLSGHLKLSIMLECSPWRQAQI